MHILENAMQTGIPGTRCSCMFFPVLPGKSDVMMKNVRTIAIKELSKFMINNLTDGKGVHQNLSIRADSGKEES